MIGLRDCVADTAISGPCTYHAALGHSDIRHYKPLSTGDQLEVTLCGRAGEQWRRAGEVPGRRDAEMGPRDQGRRHRAGVTAGAAP